MPPVRASVTPDVVVLLPLGQSGSTHPPRQEDEPGGEQHSRHEADPARAEGGSLESLLDGYAIREGPDSTRRRLVKGHGTRACLAEVVAAAEARRRVCALHHWRRGTRSAPAAADGPSAPRVER